jgi:ClpP class serine protease
MAMAGIKAEAIVSEGSTMKLAGASFKPLTDTERKMFQADVNVIRQQFIAAIRSKRDVSAETYEGEKGGAVFSGEDAVKNGLADGLVNDFDEFADLISQGSPHTPH